MNTIERSNHPVPMKKAISEEVKFWLTYFFLKVYIFYLLNIQNLYESPLPPPAKKTPKKVIKLVFKSLTS